MDDDAAVIRGKDIIPPPSNIPSIHTHHQQITDLSSPSNLQETKGYDVRVYQQEPIRSSHFEIKNLNHLMVLIGS